MSKHVAASFVKKNPLLCFFGLAYAISWVIWLPLIYGRFKFGWITWEGNPWREAKTIIGIMGALGPALAAVIVTGITEGKEKVKGLLKRLVQWRVNIVWWLVGFFGWWCLVSLNTLAYGLSSLQNVAFAFLISLVNIPVIIAVLQLPFLFGMIGEELGWRGYAMPKLLEKYNPIVASIILSMPWIFWHAPLAVFEGWRGHMPILEFALSYILLVIPLTVIFTFFYQKVNGSVLLVIVFHRAFNVTFNAFSQVLKLDQSAADLIRKNVIIDLWIIALIVCCYYALGLRKKRKVELQISES